MKGHIDKATFDQILEMDDDPDDRDFSMGIVVGFFEQAEGTFKKMEKALYVPQIRSRWNPGLIKLHLQREERPQRAVFTGTFLERLVSYSGTD